MSAIYLDYNATTPVDPQVAEAMLPYVHGLFGNPSSSHGFGLAPARAWTWPAARLRKFWAAGWMS